MDDPVTRRQTRRLFKQFVTGAPEDLNEWRARFVAQRDPTEYKGAIELVGTWQEWLRFKKEWPDFRENILPEWVLETEVLIRSEALDTVVKDSTTGSKSATSSAKWVVEGHYKPRKPGGGTKAEKTRENIIRQRAADENDDEINRVVSFVQR